MAKHNRQDDPTEEQIEARKLEIIRYRELNYDPLSRGNRDYVLRKYMEMAHDETMHDIFDDVRRSSWQNHEDLCDCPYWEHERRNPEF